MGVVGDYGGHHCSWCFTAEDIRFKLLTAQMADGPRWGNYPEKTDVKYIEGLVKKGEDEEMVTRVFRQIIRPFLIVGVAKMQEVLYICVYVYACILLRNWGTKN